MEMYAHLEAEKEHARLHLEHLEKKLGTLDDVSRSLIIDRIVKLEGYTWEDGTYSPGLVEMGIATQADLDEAYETLSLHDAAGHAESVYSNRVIALAEVARERAEKTAQAVEQVTVVVSDFDTLGYEIPTTAIRDIDCGAVMPIAPTLAGCGALAD